MWNASPFGEAAELLRFLLNLAGLRVPLGYPDPREPELEDLEVHGDRGFCDRFHMSYLLSITLI